MNCPTTFRRQSPPVPPKQQRQEQLIANNILKTQLRDQQATMKSLSECSKVCTIVKPSCPDELLLLLATPQDERVLSKALCVLRKSIEVFTVTEVDIKARALMRRKPIHIGQVGLGCVHCRMHNEAERGSFYPHSIQRITAVVAHLRNGHFKTCPYLPHDLKEHVGRLEPKTPRDVGRYFRKAARELGMFESGDEMRIDLARAGLVDAVEMRETEKEVRQNMHPPPPQSSSPPPPPKQQQRQEQRVILGKNIATQLCDQQQAIASLSGCSKVCTVVPL